MEIIKKTFKEKNHGLTKKELAIAKAPIQELLNEFYFIIQKKSKLSSHLRQVVKIRIDYLINEGIINKNELIYYKKVNEEKQKTN